MWYVLALLLDKSDHFTGNIVIINLGTADPQLTVISSDSACHALEGIFLERSPKTTTVSAVK